MRIRSTGLVLFAGLSIFVAACSSTVSREPVTSCVGRCPRSQHRRRPPRPRPLRTTRPVDGADLGRPDLRPQDRRRDRRRHARRQELQRVHYKGGRPARPPSAPPTRLPSSRRTLGVRDDIQAFVDEGANIIVTVGFNLAPPRSRPRQANPDIQFIGVDQVADLRR